MKLSLQHLRIAVSCIWVSLVLFAVAAFAVRDDSSSQVADAFDRDLYSRYLHAAVSSENDILSDYAWQQVVFMPILVPDPSYELVQFGGVLPVLDWSGFSKGFLDGLVPIQRNGLTCWPVAVLEDATTHPPRRLILNANGETIAQLVVDAPDYDSTWWVQAMYPWLYDSALTPQDLNKRSTLEKIYTGSRLIMEYTLVDQDGLIGVVWSESLGGGESMAMESSPPPPPPGETGEGDAHTGGIEQWDIQATYTNLQIAGMASAPTSCVITVGVGIPDAMTNANITVFACTNLVTPEWIPISITNAPSSTNILKVVDLESTNHTVRFYRAASLSGTLFPQQESFETGKVGRVMISTIHDNHYYTDTATTLANGPAQTNDGEVVITAHLPTYCAGMTVYFRSVDPDDMSSYETDSLPNDNRDTNVHSGVLSATSDTAELATIDGKEVAAAEVVLTFTGQFAGDNYQIECALDSGFETVIDRTCVMVAWKRMYLEEDKMYRVGANLAEDFTPDADPDPDSIATKSTSENGGFPFQIGDEIRIFDADDPVGELATITNFNRDVEPDILYLNIDLTNSYNAGYSTGDRGAAVAVPDRNQDGTIDAFDADFQSYIAAAFGAETDGSDGGCFVEFIDLTEETDYVPYTWSLNGSRSYSISYWSLIDMWFSKVSNKKNTVYLLGATHYPSLYFYYGNTVGERNTSILYVENIERFAPSPSVFNPETVVHEIGHLWAWEDSETDRNHPDTWCHEGTNTQLCIMDYSFNGDFLDESLFTDGKTEFCDDYPACIYKVRDRAQGGQ